MAKREKILHSQNVCSINHFVILLLVSATIVLSGITASKVLFQTVRENAVIDGIEPFFDQDVGNKLKCYAICQRKADQCLFVEVSKRSKTKWSCRLFEFTGDIQNHLKPAASAADTAVVSTPTLKRDCLDLLNNGFKKDGVYYIGFSGSPRKVFCDMTTEGGGWIVMQKRLDGSVDFYRNWDNYANGFGNVYGEYWLGNEFVHQYTNAHPTEMIGEATDFDGVRVATKLKNFKVSDSSSKYTLQYTTCIVLSGDGKLCTEDWQRARNRKFGTFDMDNDNVDYNCVVRHGGAWWLDGCFRVNFNGIYSSVPTVEKMASGIHWYNFQGWYVSLKETKMLIKRVQWKKPTLNYKSRAMIKRNSTKRTLPALLELF